MGRSELDRVRETSQTGARFDRNGKPPRPERTVASNGIPRWRKKRSFAAIRKRLPQSGDIVVRDVESEDMGDAAARAVVALLDSRQSDPPRSLVGDGERVDPSTGEVIDKRTLADFPSDQPDEPAIVEPELNPPPPEPARPAEPPTVEGEPEPDADQPDPSRSRSRSRSATNLGSRGTTTKPWPCPRHRTRPGLRNRDRP